VSVTPGLPGSGLATVRVLIELGPGDLEMYPSIHS
jgi:hypothetical protein